MRKGQRHTEASRMRISKSQQNRSEETRRRMSEAQKGKKATEETRRKMSEAQLGEKNHFFGKKHTAESKAKISIAATGRVISDETRVKLKVIQRVVQNRPDIRAANIASSKGKNNWNWQGGLSFEPYCPLFNNTIKEKIRNRDGRVCQLCGKPEILNGERLSIHHIDGDKTQGCNGKKWYLCSLCRSCNSKVDTSEKEFLIITNIPQVMQEVK